ncbi:MAG: polyprenol monophosphomannose synthase [Cryomorphaceae bacterium]|nr:MAG: polyprenol monophosphomannose synthase [Cryomorphaceae bacterium]|tara:strand:- start:44 stop:772 length:729 start_codon:yes stop_codon:yes gene_type:complete
MYKGNSLVIIPSYNESENIIEIINDITKQKESFNVLIVDDNSPDKTYELVEEEIIKKPKRVFLIRRKKKLGLGTAYIEGFKWAIDNGYERIFEMDADYSHDPKDLSRMNVFLDNDGFDVVIGSRYISGVNVVNWPIQRVLLSYFASIYARLITGVPLTDLTSGFVGYKVSVLKSVLNENVRFNGYAFQIEMKFKAYSKGFKIIEIPIIFTDRTKGESKMSLSIVWEAVFGLLLLKIKQLFKF